MKRSNQREVTHKNKKEQSFWHAIRRFDLVQIATKFHLDIHTVTELYCAQG